MSDEDETVCETCGESYVLGAGLEPTRWCNPCAQEIAASATAEHDAERQRADRLAETLESVRDCKKDRCKQCQVLIHRALAHPGKGEPQG